MKAKWLDLSRFDAKLSVLPESPIRPRRAMLIEMLRSSQEMSLFDLIGMKEALVAAMGKDGLRASSSQQHTTSGKLLYSLMVEGSDLKFNEVKVIFPDLAPSDIKEMDVSDISQTIMQSEAVDLTHWQETQPAISSDARDVWVVKDGNAAKAIADVGAKQDFNTLLHYRLHINKKSRWAGIAGTPSILRPYHFFNRLHHLGHQPQDSLIECYPTKEVALRAGYSEDQLHQQTLEHALPLMVCGEAVLAISDVRHCPEVLNAGINELLTNVRRGPGLIFDFARLVESEEFYAKQDQLCSTIKEALDDSVERDWAALEASLRSGMQFFQELEQVHPIKLAQNEEPVNFEELEFPDLIRLAATTHHETTGHAEKGDECHFDLLGMDHVEEIGAINRAVEAYEQAKLELLSEQAEQNKADLLTEAASGSGLASDDGTDIQSGDGDEEVPHVHEDYGEKIGGARKDLYGQTLVLGDLEKMNEIEKLTLLVKPKLWPPLKLSEMKEQGYSAQAAVSIKYIRDRLPSKLSGKTLNKLARMWDDESDFSGMADFYAQNVINIRDHLMPCKTIKELNIGLIELGLSSAEHMVSDKPVSNFDEFINAFSDLVDEKIAYGQCKKQSVTNGYNNFVRLLPRRLICLFRAPVEYFDRFNVDHAAENPLNLERRDYLERLVPTDKIIESLLHGGCIKSAKCWNMDSIRWEHLIRRSEQKAESEKSTKKDGSYEEFRKAEAKRQRELRKRTVKHLKSIERTGEPVWRDGDIKAEDLAEKFGFRAIEFGEWLPQKERQQVLNHAYDAMCDIALATGLKPEALSFGGKLALAFGSRGRSKARAHFEPARNVINLTRMNGAGSLAHEFMHAFDFHLNDENRTRNKDPRQRIIRNQNPLLPLATETGYLITGDDLTLDDLMEQITHAATVDEGIVAARESLEREIYVAKLHLADYFSQAYEDGDFEQWLSKAEDYFNIKENFERAQDGMLRGWEIVSRSSSDLDNLVRRSDSSSHIYDQSKSFLSDERGRADQPRAIWVTNALRNVNIYFSCQASLAVLNHNDTVLRAVSDEASREQHWRSMSIEPRAYLPKTEKSRRAHKTAIIPCFKQSGFLAEARLLDSTRAKSYWSTPSELFARAGEAFIYDKLNKELDVRSDYLVRDVDPQKDWPSPYPRGGQREAINREFEKVFAQYALWYEKNVEIELDVDEHPLEMT